MLMFKFLTTEDWKSEIYIRCITPCFEQCTYKILPGVILVPAVFRSRVMHRWVLMTSLQSGAGTQRVRNLPKDAQLMLERSAV